MLGHFRASLLSIALLCALAVQENVSAQVTHFSDAFLSDVRVTQSGQPVAVRIADPFARLDQERALLKFLNQPHAYGWDTLTTISDIQRDVGKHIALQIDHRALEEIGVTADELVFPESGASAKKKRPSGTPTEDPFASHPSLHNAPEHHQPQSPAAVLTATSTEQHWWDKKPTTPPAEQMTNAAKLFHGLSNADLVIATWSGQWLITTEEAAEENLSTRLYDVTPIANIEDSPPSHPSGGRMNSLAGGFRCGIISSDDVLIDVVQTTVDPNAWEALGGPSTCRVVLISGRTWLVMSSPVTTHWKVQALLNQLNGS